MSWWVVVGACVAGALAAPWLPLPPVAAVGVTALGCLTGALLWRGGTTWRSWALAALGVATACLLRADFRDAGGRDDPAREVTVEGCVARRSPSTRGGSLATVRSGRDRLTVWTARTDALPGDRVVMRARVREQRGREDYAGFASSVAVVDRGGCGHRLARARSRWIAELGHWLGPDRGAIAAAMATGARGGLRPAVVDVFRRTGTVHVLVVSGLHLSLVLVVVAAALRAGLMVWRRTRGWDLRVPAMAAGLLAATAFLYYVGPGIPVVRAWVVGALALWIWIGRRRFYAWRLWGVVLACVLVADPAAVSRPGFQLSFAAVAGIIACHRFHPDWKGPARTLGRLVCATFGACVATTPLIAFHFQRVPALGLLATGAASLLALCTLPLLLVLTGAHLVSPDWAGWGLIVVAPLIDVSWESIRAAAALPASSVVWTPSVCGVVAAYVGLVAWWRGRRQTWGRGLAVVASLLVVLDACGVLAVSRRLEVTFLDVGHGDSVLVRAPDGALLLVDGGGSRTSAARRIVVPHVRRARRHQRAHELTVAVTHAHDDHIGGLGEVASELEVDSLWAPVGLDLASLEWLAEESPANLRTLEAGDAFVWHEVDVQVLHPRGPQPAGDLNDQSLVLRLEWGAHSVLLTGDIGAVSEGALVEQGLDAVQLVKVPHHGSDSSSTADFVRRLHPQWAVISVGPSPWHLPKPVVEERWARTGAQLYRTDRCGTVYARATPHAGKRAWRLRTERNCTSGVIWTRGQTARTHSRRR